MIITETILYSDGFYFRKSNRIYLLPNKAIPAGIEVIPETFRIEKDCWINLFREVKDGVSYEVVGWVK